jgi:hypothetical protein
MSTSTPARPAPASRHEAFVRAQLQQARQRIRLLDTTASLLGLAILTLVYGLAMILTDRAWELPALARQTAFGAYLVLAAAYVGYTLVRPWCRRLNPYYAAQHVEQTLPEAKNSIVSWLDLHEQPLPASIRAAVSTKAARDLAEADLESAFSARRNLWLTAGLFALLFGLFAQLVIGGPQFFSLLRRAFSPFTEGRISTRTQLTLLQPEHGDVTVPVGRAVSFVAQVGGKVPSPNRPDALRLLYRYHAEDPYEEQRLEPGDHPGEWATILPAYQVHNGFWYKLAGGDAATPEYRVSVRSTPLLTDFEATYHYRPYLGWKDQTTREPNLKALRGTEVTLLARTNRNVRAGRLELIEQKQFLNAERVAGEPQAMRFQWVLDQGGTYRITFTSDEDERNSDPLPFEIKVLPDLAPRVALTPPGQDATLPLNGQLQLRGSANDDFGLAAVNLHMQVGDKELPPLPYPKGGLPRQPDGSSPRNIDYQEAVALDQLALDGKKLTVGTVLEYWLEATDHCDYPPPGPNVGKSERFKATLAAPTAEQQPKPSDEPKANQKQQPEKNQPSKESSSKEQPPKEGQKDPSAQPDKNDGPKKPQQSGEQGKGDSSEGGGQQQPSQKNDASSAEGQRSEPQTPEEQKLEEQKKRLDKALQDVEKEKKEAQNNQNQQGDNSGSGNSQQPNKQDGSPQKSDAQNQQPGNQNPSQPKPDKQGSEPNKQNAQSGQDPNQKNPQNGQGKEPNKQNSQSGQGQNPGQKNPQNGQGKEPNKQDSQSGQGQDPNQKIPQNGQGSDPNKQNAQGGQGQDPNQKNPQNGQNDPKKQDSAGGAQAGNSGKSESKQGQQQSGTGEKKPGEGGQANPQPQAKPGGKEQSNGKQGAGSEASAPKDNGSAKPNEPQGGKPEQKPGGQGQGEQPTQGAQGQEKEKSGTTGNAAGEKGPEKKDAGQPDNQPGAGSPNAEKEKAKPSAGQGDSDPNKGADAGKGDLQKQSAKAAGEPKDKQGQPKPDGQGTKVPAKDSTGPKEKGDAADAPKDGDKGGKPEQVKAEKNEVSDPNSPAGQAALKDLIEKYKNGDAKTRQEIVDKLRREVDKDPAAKAKLEQMLKDGTAGADQQPAPGRGNDKPGERTRPQPDKSEAGKPGEPGGNEGAAKGSAEQPKPGERGKEDNSPQPGKSKAEKSDQGQPSEGEGAGNNPKGDLKPGPAGNKPGLAADGPRDPANGNSGEQPEAAPADPRFQKRAGELQLEDFKKRVNKDVLEKANMTPEEYQKFEQAYREMLKRRQADAAAKDEKLAAPQRAGGQLPNLGPRQVQGGPKKDATQGGVQRHAPPEFIEKYREFTEKLSELKREKDR